MSILTQPFFHDEAAAFAKLESIVWPNGPVCPHCGSVDRITKVGGKTARMGLRRCGWCKRQFTVKVGTVFESSHVPLHKWLQAAYLMMSSKKGISSHQLFRTLEVTYKTAWFMTHRLREAMRDGALLPLGGEGKVIEADETYFGHKEGQTRKRARKNKALSAKRAVVALVERGGEVRSFYAGRADKKTVCEILDRNASRQSRLMTDESPLYLMVGQEFAGHETVHHSSHEYVRGEAHTNTVEGYFSVFKRGMIGVYQHCGERHLHRYLAEFDFRYNRRARLGYDDQARTMAALRGIVGKRLTYRDSSLAAG